MPLRKISVSYYCTVCNTEYPTRKAAAACECMPKEKQKYEKGDVVQAAREKFRCSTCGPFIPSGRITEVVLVGNDGSTQDYVLRWLSHTQAALQLGKVHLYRYAVEYQCPQCGRMGESLFFTIELKRYKKPGGSAYTHGKCRTDIRTFFEEGEPTPKKEAAFERALAHMVATSKRPGHKVKCRPCWDYYMQEKRATNLG
jgi:hypothetical protein